MRVLVIGGDATGMSAASQIKRKLRDGVDVTVLNHQRWTSYSACGIPYWVGGEVPGDADVLVARSPEEHRARGLDVRVGVVATAIDPHRQTVTVQGVDSPESAETLHYDHLVIATGAKSVRPGVPGIELPGVLPVHTIDDGIAAIDAMHRGAQRAVIVGGGFIGVEMAEATHLRGLDTVVIERAPEPMITMDPDMGTLIRAEMARLGVRFHGEEPLLEFVADADGQLAEVRTGKGEYPADLAFLGTGFQPRAELARDAGLPVGDFGGIQIDEQCRVVGYANIWAGGDCTEGHHRVSGRPTYLPLGSHANKQGRVIGLNVCGGKEVFPGVIGTAITRFMGVEIARVGLREAQARDFGMDVATATITANTTAGYFPDAQQMKVKMIGNRSDGRVVGCQIVGGRGAGKRIDSVATAMWNRMTAAEMINLDLAYAPPFSPVWDPVLVAARQLAAALEG
jgi:NADPH-dependent 2,4-dienoyl-CoA reductase/sulfur reductase-like enzyme